MSVRPSQIVGSKLGGVSGNQLKFTTNGQNETNSNPTKVVADITNVTISGDYYNDWLYYDTHSKTSDNAHDLKFHWNSYHNTPGNITGTFTPYISGTGSTSTNRVNYPGETKSLNVSNLSFNPTTVNRSNISSNTAITMVFPPYYEGTAVEDGKTITVHTQDYGVASSDYEAKKYTGLGLVAYNTPNPVLNIAVSSANPSIAMPVDASGNACNILTRSSSGFSGAVNIKVMPNVPDSSLGTVDGTVTISPSKTSNDGIYGGTSNTFTCTNNGSGFVFTPADNTHSVTYARETTVSFTYSSETNNVNGISHGNLDKTITIYQSGGNVTLPDPTITYSWKVTSGSDYINTTANSGNQYTFNFKDNSGTKSKVYNKGGNAITLSPTPSNASSNEGGDTQYMKLVNFAYDRETNTSVRSTSFEGIVSCQNAFEGAQGKLNGSWFEMASGSRQPWSSTKPTSGTIIGVGSADYTLYQDGVTWPKPNVNIRVTATPDASNPTNVTNDTSRKVTCFVGSSTSDLSEGSATFNANINDTEPQVVIHTESFRPAAIGAKNSGSLTSYINGAEVSEYNCTSLSASTTTITVKNGITFEESYIPAMGSASWTISVASVETPTNIDGTCTPIASTWKYTVPGNSRLTGQITPVKCTATLSGATNYFSISPSVQTFNKSTSSQTFTVSIAKNNQTASYAKTSIYDYYTNGKLISAVISTDRNDTTSKSCVISLTSSDSNVSINRNSLKITRDGASVGGVIKWSTSKVSGGNGYVSIFGDTDYNDGSITIGRAYGDPGSISFEPSLSDFYVGHDASSMTKTSSTSPSSSIGPDTIVSISGSISGTTINSLNGTKVQIDGSNSKNITISGYLLNMYDYFSWSFSPATGVTDVAIKSGTANSAICTLTFGTNTNTKTNYLEPSITYNADTPSITVHGGYSGDKAERTLGTLTLRYTYNNKSDSCTVKQYGYTGTNTTASVTVYKSERNCVVTQDKTYIYATGVGNTQTASATAITSAKWEEGNIGQEIAKNSTFSGISRVGEGETLNYNADTKSYTIGANVSSVSGATKMWAYGTIYTTKSTSYGTTIDICLVVINKWFDVSVSSSDITISYSWKKNGVAISDTSRTLSVTSTKGVAMDDTYSLTVSAKLHGFSCTNTYSYSWTIKRHDVKYRFTQVKFTTSDITKTAFDNPGTSWSVESVLTYTLQVSYDNGTTWTNTTGGSPVVKWSCSPQSGTGSTATVTMSQGSSGDSATIKKVQFTADLIFSGKSYGTETCTSTLTWYGKSYHNS